jgi:hypothetical protein
MEHTERIRMLKKLEKEILSDVYAVIFYIAIVLIVLSIILAAANNPIATIIVSVIMAIIYTLILIYLIGLAVAFGTIRARRLLLKAEIDVKEEETQETTEGEVDE